MLVAAKPWSQETGQVRNHGKDPKEGYAECPGVSSISGLWFSLGLKWFLELSQSSNDLPWSRAFSFSFYTFPPLFYLRPSQVFKTMVKQSER